MTDHIDVYIGLGSNIGDRLSYLKRAALEIKANSRHFLISSIYESVPVGYKCQPFYLNAVCKVETTKTPDQMLFFLQTLENKLGRTRSFANAPRKIDLDILMWGDQVIRTPNLEVPHPRMICRGFVMLPIVELSPSVIHPVERLTMAELLRKLRPSDMPRLVSEGI